MELIDAMEAQAFAPSLQETVAELFGLQDSVTLAELRAAVDVATLPGRDLIRLRRALDPVVRACSVCLHVACEWHGCPYGTLSRAVMCVVLCCVVLCCVGCTSSPRCGGSASRRSKPRQQQPRHGAWQRSRYGFVLSWMVSPGVVAPRCWVEIVCWLVVFVCRCLGCASLLLLVVVVLFLLLLAVSWHRVGVLLFTYVRLLVVAVLAGSAACGSGGGRAEAPGR